MVILQPEKNFRHESEGVVCQYRGRLHSFKDKPAITYPDGRLYWYKDGVIHRGYDKPAIISENAEMWLSNGKFHRINGPAVKWTNGRQEYYVRGQLHREDGPAVIDPKKGDEHWIDGKQV